jgi:hypothetical protein
VVCYTNAASARLMLNGQPVGGQPQRDPSSDILYWDIDYQPGTLRCEADNGASYEIATTKAPYGLRLSTDSSMHVFVEVVDEDGRVVKNATNEVTLMVDGSRLLGMENGDIMDNSIAGSRQRNRLNAHNGRLVAYLQPQASRKVTIRATSPFLQPATLTLDGK